MRINDRMTQFSNYPVVWLLCLALLPLPGTKQNSASSVAQQAGGELEAVLSQLDSAAAKFRSAQADFEWDNYQKVVDETEKQEGKVNFRRAGNDADAMFDINSPPKQVLFKSGKLMLYNPKIDQVTEYTPGKNKTDVEAFLNLGFGARGHDLLKSYTVKMEGWETVDGVKTAKLQLTPLSEKVRNMFNQFVLWIDPQRDVPIKQQVLQPSGDYWLSHYTNFKLNIKIPDSVFRINTTSRTKVIRPQ